ncbi:MAG TPA: hypothetical protein ENN51_08385, partial [candidate division WOR-3 bacterium]|nr:hypothetical protein [candidate division WOR-3 bacterium]
MTTAAGSRKDKTPARRAESAIRFIRDRHVVLDADLAALYGVETRALVQAVKR